jgi:putative IMPACT (imprinted ancient) family translation regulator
LGKGGLVKAYTESAQLVVNTVPRAIKSWVHEISISPPYNQLESIHFLIKKYHGTILGENFSAEINMVLSIPVDKYSDSQEDLKVLSSGKLTTAIIATREKLIPSAGH